MDIIYTNMPLALQFNMWTILGVRLPLRVCVGQMWNRTLGLWLFPWRTRLVKCLYGNVFKFAKIHLVQVAGILYNLRPVQCDQLIVPQIHNAQELYG